MAGPLRIDDNKAAIFDDDGVVCMFTDWTPEVQQIAATMAASASLVASLGDILGLARDSKWQLSLRERVKLKAAEEVIAATKRPPSDIAPGTDRLLVDVHTALNEAVAKGVDIHGMMASMLLGMPLTDVDRDLRRAIKAVNYGIIYGNGQALHGELVTYLDKCITNWRTKFLAAWGKGELGDCHTAICYVDAFQCVRMSAVGETLPADETMTNTYNAWRVTRDKPAHGGDPGQH